MHLAGINFSSVADGPGVRMVLFFQGCPHDCKGCQNPGTHAYMEVAPFEKTVEDILELVRKDPLLQGITLSGGEPISPSNFEDILELVKQVKAEFPKLSIWCYTGYYLEDAFIRYPAFISELSKYVDAYVDGPFVEKEKCPSLSFRGSANQRICKVYEMED